MKKLFLLLSLLTILFIVGCSSEKDVQTDSEVEENTNSRSNPALFGESVTCETYDFEDNKFKLELTLLEVIRGEEANNIILDANPVNSPPEEGMEYILAKFKVKVLEAIDDNSLQIYCGDFEPVRKDGAVYNEFVALTIYDLIEAELYKEGENEGYVYLQVDIGDEPLIRYEYDVDKYLWFNPNK